MKSVLNSGNTLFAVKHFQVMVLGKYEVSMVLQNVGVLHHHNTEDHDLNLPCCENLIFHI